MLDAPLRKLFTPALARAAGAFARPGADALTTAGFVVGLAAIPAIATRHSWIGLALLLLNRLFDALDGAVARRTRTTNLGAFLDRAFDLIVFMGVPFAFALADPSRALAGAFFVFAIAASGATVLVFEVLAARQGSPGDIVAGHLGRLMENTELTLALAIACIAPAWFGIIAYSAGILCFIAAGACIAAAFARFGEP